MGWLVVDNFYLAELDYPVSSVKRKAASIFIFSDASVVTLSADSRIIDGATRLGVFVNKLKRSAVVFFVSRPDHFDCHLVALSCCCCAFRSRAPPWTKAKVLGRVSRTTECPRLFR